MRTRTFRLMCLASFLLMAAYAAAQEGHPLKGSWRGDWGPSASDRNHVVIVMDWDGKTITGTVNPGPNAAPIKSATLNPTDWTVHLVVDAKDRSGNTVTYMIDGKIENLGLPNRSVVGTWAHGNVRGDFRITRQ